MNSWQAAPAVWGTESFSMKTSDQPGGNPGPAGLVSNAPPPNGQGGQKINEFSSAAFR
jgi:hypothetical protein